MKIVVSEGPTQVTVEGFPVVFDGVAQGSACEVPLARQRDVAAASDATVVVDAHSREQLALGRVLLARQRYAHLTWDELAVRLDGALTLMATSGPTLQSALERSVQLSQDASAQLAEREGTVAALEDTLAARLEPELVLEGEYGAHVGDTA